MTSPPLRVPRAFQADQADTRLDESDRAVQQEHVRTAGMKRAGADERVDIAEGRH